MPMSTNSSGKVALNSLPAWKKLLLLACNMIPLGQVSAMGGLCWFLRNSPWAAVLAALGVLYILPPLLCRTALVALPIRRSAVPLGCREFFVWWFTLNLQVLFCRFPFLEELLRIIPGCYSLWLRLWGAKIGKLTYWAAGTAILDRPWLEIGDHVVFGAGVRINAHVFTPDEKGEMVLLLAPVKIGSRVTVGGYSLLVAGAQIAPDQCTRACRILPPFSRLEEGRRVKEGPMKIQAWRLPWRQQWVPHALLDILRGCNISCRACYNTEPPQGKSLEQVRHEFEILRQHRRLDSLSIVGGEPTLHPQLVEIVRLVKAAGVSVELFTNGLRLDPGLLGQLQAAGTDLVFLHIDAQQTRPDLDAAAPRALEKLRAEKAAQVAAAGLEVGLSITAYPDALGEVDEAVEFVLNSPHVDYLVVTLFRDVSAISNLSGCLETGIRGEPAAVEQRGDGLSNEQMAERLFDRFGLLPFAYVGSNLDDHDPRWVSYLIGAAVSAGRRADWAMLRASAAERLFLTLSRWLRGRYPFYVKQDPGRFRLQLLLNSLTGGRLWSNWRLLARSFGNGRTLRAKRLLVQSPAQLDPDGRLRHCRECPDASIRHGRLVPCCIADRILEGTPFR